MKRLLYTSFAICLFLPQLGLAEDTDVQKVRPLFQYLTGDSSPAMVAYTPSQLDPRQPANHTRLATSSLQADLSALRPIFDGLVLYGYDEGSTPRVLAVAKTLKYRAVLLGIWQPKSANEIDGVAALVKKFGKDFALGVAIGNEGLHRGDYEMDDLVFAADRLRKSIPANVPLTTSEPRYKYDAKSLFRFGDFLAPNIHPYWDQKGLDAKAAAAWTRKQAAELAVASGKPVLVKETGFPHASDRGDTPATQQAFWTAYLKDGVVARPAEDRQLWVHHGVAFEAFDLPWKAEASNLAVEKSWGLFSAQRKPLPALSVWRALAKDAKDGKKQ